MPTPILKIPIDDAAFQRYMRSFQKYQSELAAQPDMWKGINSSILDTAAAGAAISAEITHQTEKTRLLTKEEAKREAAAKAASKRRKDEDKEEEKRAETEKARRQKAIDQVKKYATDMKDVASDLGKWTLGGGLLGIVGSALGLFGLNDMMVGVGQERRLASGMGVSMGQRQGMGMQMQRYFDVNSTLENVANMQSNPGSWGAFRMMGINPQGKDPATLTYEAAAAARRMFIADKGNLMLAQAQGLTQVFQPDDLRRMAAESPSQFNASMRQGRQFQGLNDSVGRKWQNFEIALDTAGTKLKNSLIDKLTVLEPGLQTVVTKFGEMAEVILDKFGPPLLKGLAEGLDSFAKYLNTPQFKQDFKELIEDISQFAHKMKDLLVFLGLIPDRNNPDRSGTKGGPAGVPGEGTDLGLEGLTGGQKIMSYSANADYMTSRLRRQGWEDAQVKGILSNINAESGFNPFAVGDSGHAYGLAQWHKDRRALYTKLFGHSMESVKNRSQALLEQTMFLQWELTNPASPRKRAGERLKRQHSAFNAGWVVSTDYESPANRTLEALRRGTQAMTITLKNQTGASVATTTNSAAGGK